VDPLPPSWSVIEPGAEPTAAPGATAPAPSIVPARLAPVVAIGVAAVGAIVLAAAVVLSSQGGANRSVILPSPDRSARSSADASDVIVVEVIGAVRHPGLVRLRPDSRVADAIEAAGGFSPAVDTAAAAATLHLAKPVADGDQVRVPARGEPAPSPVAGAGGGGGGPGAPVDLNTASESELDALPGIGPATVAKIVAARTERPFASVDELRDRKIVGQATLAKIRDLLVVR
jgi:competence protein ComEA